MASFALRAGRFFISICVHQFRKEGACSPLRRAIENSQRRHSPDHVMNTAKSVRMVTNMLIGACADTISERQFPFSGNRGNSHGERIHSTAGTVPGTEPPGRG